ncbi:oxidoreductase [Coniochaeta sp. 2T2.1]|nr:oxidoreductase [Coniochaeta sp. 2T2.1]
MSAKTVLITGCTDGGIGSGLAKVFAARGIRVIAAARSISKMSGLAALPNITLVELDVRSADSIAAAIKMVSAETLGSLDYLVNNAGVAYRCATLEIDDRMARDVFDVNFWGTVDMCRAFAPMVIKAKGTIVNVSSLGGVGVPMLWSSVYTASKAAVATYSDTLRLELSAFGVKVLVVLPAAVETNMNNARTLASATLPKEGSIFKPAEKHIAKATIYERMSVDKFSEKVVGDILSGKTGWTWRGAFATRCWLIMRFLPQAALDKLVTINQGLDLVGKD